MFQPLTVSPSSSSRSFVERPCKTYYYNSDCITKVFIRENPTHTFHSCPLSDILYGQVLLLLRGGNNLIGICLLAQLCFVLGARYRGAKQVGLSPRVSGAQQTRKQNHFIRFLCSASPRCWASIHSKFLNCIFCERRYYNGMHYITLGGQMSETMSGIIAECGTYRVVSSSNLPECSLLCSWWSFIITLSSFSQQQSD